MSETHIPTKDLAEIRKYFHLFDSNDDGYIKTDNIGNLLRICRKNPTEAEVADMVNQVNSYPKGKICFDDFIKLLDGQKFKYDCTDEETLRKAFLVADKDGSGFIDKTELERLMCLFGEQLTKDEIDAMMKDADINKDEKLSYEEWTKLITENPSY